MNAVADPATALRFSRPTRPSQRSWRAVPLPLGLRVAILGGLLLAHLGLLVWFAPQPPSAAPAAASVTPVLVLLSRAPPPPPPPSPRRRSSLSIDAARPARRAPSAPPDVVPQPSEARSVPAEPSTALRLFRSDGGLSLPASVQDDLAAVTAPGRTFELQVPGALEAGEFLQRPEALSYDATRFDEHWIEPKDVLTEALHKAVEKSTVTIRVPVPRAPGSKVVCKVVLAALAGSCGVVNLGQGYVVELDDPDTLNPEEQRQCQGWWDEIVAAKTPEALRRARERYESHCRKPAAAR